MGPCSVTGYGLLLLSRTALHCMLNNSGDRRTMSRHFSKNAALTSFVSGLQRAQRTCTYFIRGGMNVACLCKIARFARQQLITSL